MEDEVAAAGQLATVGTAILIDTVAVVALFGQINPSVTTGFEAAGGAASVALLLVAVVTLLVAKLFGAAVETPDRVPTASRLAAVGAGIGIVSITIIAVFDAVLERAVSTARWGTVAQASIRIGVVTIITKLPCLDDPVPATGGLAVGTVVGGVLIAVIAALAGAQDPITAATFNAIGEASVAIVIVPVITGFKAWIARV